MEKFNEILHPKYINIRINTPTSMADAIEGNNSTRSKWVKVN
jgi:hypothetical protein